VVLICNASSTTPCAIVVDTAKGDPYFPTFPGITRQMEAQSVSDEANRGVPRRIGVTVIEQCHISNHPFLQWVGHCLSHKKRCTGHAKSHAQWNILKEPANPRFVAWRSEPTAAGPDPQSRPAAPSAPFRSSDTRMTVQVPCWRDESYRLIAFGSGTFPSHRYRERRSRKHGRSLC
jgi:hypothetical protein